MDDWRARSPQAAIKRAVAAFVERADRDGPARRAGINSNQPDAVFADLNSSGAAASGLGGPWRRSSFTLSRRLAGPCRRFGPGLRPAGRPAGRLRGRLLGPRVTERARQARSAVVPA